jgi:cyanophycinase
VHAAMLDLFKRGGVFMGTSAGATIMGTLLVGGDARKDLTKPFDFPAALNYFPIRLLINMYWLEIVNSI